jgi:hypothetical protein
MPLLRIGKETESRLLNLPESGMGYQIVEYQKQPWVVFNATVTLPFAELRETLFSEEDYVLLSGNPESEQILALTAVEMEEDIPLIFSTLDPNLRNRSLGLGFCQTPLAPNAYFIPQGWPHSYYRFCAYHVDKRVDPNGDFLPGTYATTYADLHFVPSGFAAVGRYALPNPASAAFISTIVTFQRPNLVGTATPNFGQAGGGVEVLFKVKASNHSGVSFMITVG